MQYALHLAACQLFQSGAHDGHTVQEQRNAAQQRGNVCDIHNDTPNMKLPFLSFTAHSCRNLARAQHLPCSGSRLFLLYHQRGRLNKVYFTRKLLFSHIPQHISGWQTKSFPLFYIHFTLYHLGCGMPPLTRPALPWPRAPYRPKTGTHHCRCIPPHDCPHNATQNPSWCFPPVFLFCSGAFPVNTVSHNSDTIKRTFKGFCGLFA